MTISMKPFRQLVAVLTLLWFFGVSGAECLVSSAAQMSSADKLCCQQMAGQCDMGMAAEHPCCKKIAPQNYALLNEEPHRTPTLLSWSLPILGTAFFLRAPVTQLFPHFEWLGRPPKAPPSSSITILRI